MYKKFLDKLDNILSSLSATLFFLIFAVSIVEIICRGIFNFSLLWTVEFSTLLASWTMFLGAAVMVHRNDHLIVDLVINKLPPKSKRILHIFNSIAILILMGILFFYGLESAAAKMNMRFTTLGWKMGYSFYALPVFAFFSILFLIERISNLLKGVTRNEQGN
ncbi:MAG: hypothetical protein APF77_18035 [Clostridia bacterium BRH_c25]|nr:MAG: hypothetical protein APF77_18035 [Clostridia bacterium BRH_c25]